MKKCVAAVLMCLLVIGNFSACETPQRKGHELAEEIKSAFGTDFEGCEIVVVDRMTVNKEKELFSTLYHSETLPKEMLSLSVGIYFLSLRDDGFEIQLLKVRHRSARPAAELLLRRRLEYLQSAEMRRYFGEDYQRYLASAAVYTYGNWVFLLATGKNDAAVQKLKNVL